MLHYLVLNGSSRMGIVNNYFARSSVMMKSLLLILFILNIASLLNGVKEALRERVTVIEGVHIDAPSTLYCSELSSQPMNVSCGSLKSLRMPKLAAR